MGGERRAYVRVSAAQREEEGGEREEEGEEKRERATAANKNARHVDDPAPTIRFV